TDQNGNATLEYRDFGVRLVFTPVVLEGDRIQIHLMPEVSGINGFTDSGDPIFNTRTLDATVELRDGQSFSVAGLLQNNTNLSQDQLPWIGDVPIIGSLFKSSSFQKHDTELVVIVTPRLVRPTVPGQTVATPFDQTVPANDAEFFALGQVEVTSRVLKSIETGAGVNGPYGYIIDLGDGSGARGSPSLSPRWLLRWRWAAAPTTTSSAPIASATAPAMRFAPISSARPPTRIGVRSVRSPGSVRTARSKPRRPLR